MALRSLFSSQEPLPPGLNLRHRRSLRLPGKGAHLDPYALSPLAPRLARTKFTRTLTARSRAETGSQWQEPVPWSLCLIVHAARLIKEPGQTETVGLPMLIARSFEFGDHAPIR